MSTAAATFPEEAAGRETAAQDRFPPQIKYIVGNEACERYSYYGMRSILTIFMVQYLAMATTDATAIYHLFVGACYLLPLLGAFISDRYLGKYRTIIYLSLVYCAGHAVLAIWETRAGLFWGLGLIALGSGGIKPCVSAHVGDQFTEANKHMVKKVFDLFYWMINFGSTFSTLITPWTLPRYGPGWAFGVPGILMAIATWVFWLGRKQYVHVPPTGKTGAKGFMPVFLYSLRNLGKRKAGQAFFEPAKERFKPEEVEGAEAAWSILKLFAMVSMFWALFDQHGSTWVLQATEMDLQVLGMKLEASQIAALNPIMVMALIPIFSFGIYPLVEKLGIKVTPLRKMSAGMVVAGTSFLAAALVQVPLDQGIKISAGWQFVQYLLITIAEVMISIPGLEFAYSQSPRSMKSTIMSFWLLSVFAGNLLTAYVAKVNVFEGAAFFFFFAAMMGAVSLLFIWAASRFRVRDYYEKGRPAAAH